MVVIIAIIQAIRYSINESERSIEKLIRKNRIKLLTELVEELNIIIVNGRDNKLSSYEELLIEELLRWHRDFKYNCTDR